MSSWHFTNCKKATDKARNSKVLQGTKLIVPKTLAVPMFKIKGRIGKIGVQVIAAP